MSRFKDANGTILLTTAFLVVLAIGFTHPANARGPKPSINMTVACALAGKQLSVTATFADDADAEVNGSVSSALALIEQQVRGFTPAVQVSLVPGNGGTVWSLAAPFDVSTLDVKAKAVRATVTMTLTNGSPFESKCDACDLDTGLCPADSL